MNDIDYFDKNQMATLDNNFLLRYSFTQSDQRIQ